MAASSMAMRTRFLLLPLARQLLAPRSRLLPPPPARRLCLSLQLLRHCASSSSSRCELAQRQAPSTAHASASCAPSDGDDPAAESGGDDVVAGAGSQNKGDGDGPPAPLTQRAAPARRRRPPSPPKGRPGLPRQSGGAKVHATDATQAKRKGKGRRRKPSPPGPPPGPPRQGPGRDGGVIHSLPSSSTSTPRPSSSSSS